MKKMFLLVAVLVFLVNCKESTDEATITAYNNVCASCHGQTGMGDGIAGQALEPKPRNFSSGEFKYGNDLASIKKTIAEGSPGTAMVGYKAQFTDEQITKLAKYVLSFSQKK